MDQAMTSGARPGAEGHTDLIAQACAHDAMLPPTGQGKLRTYLGIAPGVGKTYAMLRDARARRRSGTDTVVAYLERHARPTTAAQLDDLEVLPARKVTYQGASLPELDVTAVLDRRPELAVVDELAHANLPGERHARRWQDVSELLANGIDVYTTLNVANIESIDQPPKARLEQDRRLLGEVGGTLRQIRADDPASGLIRAARKAGACQLVIGSRRRSRWSRLLNGSTVADQVLRAAGDLPV
jgi:K+-sensing histidine kinase KdpD